MQHNGNNGDTVTTQHLFEIPWNGDPALLQRISAPGFRDKVKFVYLPCASEHGRSRSHCVYGTGIADFKKAARMIMDAGFRPCVLMQREIDPDALGWYFNLGIRHFTVGLDDTARRIRKELGEEAYITASITKDLMDDEFRMYAEEEPGLYDIFILRFGYSRDIEGMEALPKNLRYD